MKQVFLTQKGPKAIGPYSTCAQAGNTFYLSGMVPVNPETGRIDEAETPAQARQALTNVRTVLGELGLTMDNVVKVTVFMTDLKEFAAVNGVYAEFFAAPYPARSCVQVCALPLGAKIEIEAIAERCD